MSAECPNAARRPGRTGWAAGSPWSHRTGRRVTDITWYRTTDGLIYAAVVLDVIPRRIVGWSIADHLCIRSMLVRGSLDPPT
jgi:transposase InsO family protein